MASIIGCFPVKNGGYRRGVESFNSRIEHGHTYWVAIKTERIIVTELKRLQKHGRVMIRDKMHTCFET
jgi:hypothetical protein